MRITVPRIEGLDLAEIERRLKASDVLLFMSCVWELCRTHEQRAELLSQIRAQDVDGFMRVALDVVRTECRPEVRWASGRRNRGC